MKMESPQIAFFQVQVTLLKARFYLAFGKLERAKALIKKTLVKFPDKLPLLGLIQKIYSDNAEWDAYFDIFKQADAHDPNSIVVKFNFGSSLVYFGRYQEAIPYFIFCADNLSTDESYWMGLANIHALLALCYSYLGLWDTAKTELQAAGKRELRDLDLIYCKLLFYIKEENFDLVQIYLDRQIRRTPKVYILSLSPIRKISLHSQRRTL